MLLLLLLWLLVVVLAVAVVIVVTVVVVVVVHRQQHLNRRGLADHTHRDREFSLLRARGPDESHCATYV